MTENLTPIATGNTFVRLVSDTVAEPPILLPAGLTPSEAFVGDLASGWIDVTAISPQPSTGWTTADGGKTFTAPAIVGPPLASVQAFLSSDIDRQAQAQRDLYVAPGGAQSATYLLKQTQAAQALSAQASNTSANMTASALATLYPYLANEIGVTVDPSSKAVATDVYGVARAVQAVLQQWQPINLAIERMRLVTKAAIGAATTVSAAQAAHDAVSWPTAPTS